MKRFIAAVMVAFVATISMTGAEAKKPFAGEYTLHLTPDPSPNVFHTAGKSACFNLNPASVDRRNLTTPASGKLTITLDSPDDAIANLGDWDLFVVNAKGAVVGQSNGATAHEKVAIKVKNKDTLTVAVCNLNGLPEAKVTYNLK